MNFQNSTLPEFLIISACARFYIGVTTKYRNSQGNWKRVSLSVFKCPCCTRMSWVYCVALCVNRFGMVKSYYYCYFGCCDEFDSHFATKYRRQFLSFSLLAMILDSQLGMLSQKSRSTSGRGKQIACLVVTTQPRNSPIDVIRRVYQHCCFPLLLSLQLYHPYICLCVY